MAREMKDSGIEWIGEIPADWKTDRLQWHLEEIKVQNSPIQSEQVLSLTIDSGVIPYEDKGNQGNKSKEKLDEYKLAYPDTLVVNSMNIIIGAVGISKYFGCVSPVYYVFKAVEGTDLRYIYYLFTNVGFQKEMRKYAKGILEIRLRISANDMLKLKIPNPSYQEQCLISKVLDEKCAKIDAVVEKTKETIEEYKRLKQSVIATAVTKGIRLNRQMKQSGIEWIGQIPADWDVLPHKYVMHKEKFICENYNNQDIISLTMNGVIVRDLNAGGKMPTTFNGYQYVEPEDLLLCLFDIDVTPRCVGVVHNYGLTSPAYSRFKVHDGYHNYYYNYLLRFIDDKKVFIHLSKNLRNSLTEADFGAIKTIAPSFDEQKEIAEYLDKKCAEIDAIIASKTTLLTELEGYKKSVIYEYVTGKKEVPTA